MIKLRKILLCNYLYWSLFVVILLLSIIRIYWPKNLYYSCSTTEITGIITSYNIDGNQLRVMVEANEKVLGTYYFKTSQEKESYKQNIELGIKVRLQGITKLPEESGTKNLFNYKNYLSHQRIYHIMEIETLTKLSPNTNPYYKVKQQIKNKLKDNAYLQTFILGEKSNIASEVKLSYQNNGISHLFAISGMHINLLATMLLKLLSKLKVEETKRYKITCLFLLSYLLLVGPSASIVRGVLFFVLFSINKIYYFYVSKINIFLITLTIALGINPFYLFDVGCWYSFSISLALLLASPKNTSYWKSLCYTSIISFIISIPISLYNFHQINLASIFYNLFYVPYISCIAFPLSLLTVLIPYLEPLYNLVTNLLEVSSLFLNHWKQLTYVFKKLPLIFYLLYFILGIFALYGIKNQKKRSIVPLLVVMILHLILPNYLCQDYIKMIDVEQGDAMLIFSKNKTALIDTGGKLSFQEEAWKQKKNKTTLANSTLLPLLKSLGIKQIDWLLLTHGDMDHAGETLQLLENIKIKHIFINEGKVNYLEQSIIRKAPGTAIAVEGVSFQVGNFAFQQLNTDLHDENDSSSVYYVTHPNISLLLTGDASTKSETYLLQKYNLEQVDILKVGHHGSTTSSSTLFLQKIQPSLALISAGKDNKFGHPKKEVLERLDQLKIPYLSTITSGTITIYPKNGQITEDRN